MRVAVLGDGLLGLSVADALRGAGVDHGVFTHRDLDVTRPSSLSVLDGYDAAVNTVAMHRLAECEEKPGVAQMVNEDGAANVARCLPTVYISTDYVFNDGGPHDECMPGETPRSVYGRTKLGGELKTLEQGGIVVRVSGLYGRYPSHKGPSFPEMFTSSYKDISLPTDQRFSPTYADDAAERIADLAIGLVGRMDPPHLYPGMQERCDGRCAREECVCGPRPEGIYHAANAGSCSWAEFAESLAEATGHRRKVTHHAAKDPLRPTNSVLRSTRLPPMRHWRLSLDAWAEWRKAEMQANRVSPLRPDASR